jgi:hypothetical protein
MELKLESLEVRDAEIGLIAQKAPIAPVRGGIQRKIPAPVKSPVGALEGC